MIRIAVTVLVTSSFAAAATAADSLQINPGLWETTSTVTMPMMTAPQKHTETRCIRKEKLDPGDFNLEKNSPCTSSDFSVNGNTASWTIDCPIQGMGSMHGEWQMTSSSDSMDGKGSMAADVNGTKMEMSMTWKGRRLGDCKE